MIPKHALLVANAAETMMRMVEVLGDVTPEIGQRFPALSDLHRALDALHVEAMDVAAMAVDQAKNTIEDRCEYCQGQGQQMHVRRSLDDMDEGLEAGDCEFCNGAGVTTPAPATFPKLNLAGRQAWDAGYAAALAREPKP